jgi:uncharacterized membrane protein YeaQ/YmgE (transglycosylase-associated protein family)
MKMGLLGWILFGLITGFVASRVVNQRGEGCILNIALGILGACVGGFIFNSIGGAGITGFNLYSMFVAVIGAIVVLVVLIALDRASARQPIDWRRAAPVAIGDDAYIATATTVAITTFTTRRAIVTASSFTWTRFINNYLAAIKIFTIKFINSSLSFVSIWHFNETKPTG